MQINNVFLRTTTVGQPEGAQAEAARKVEAAATGQAESNAQGPSAELKRLVELVRQTPDVRADRLEQIAQRLASGYYQSQEAAIQTAQAITDSLE